MALSQDKPPRQGDTQEASLGAGHDFPAVMEVSVDAIVHNFQAVRQAVGPRRKVIASIKANAYGHGAEGVAGALRAAGAAVLAVDDIDDALAVKRVAGDCRVLLLNELPPDRLAGLAGSGLIPTIGNVEALRVLEAAGAGSTPVFVKVDCGFGRFGVPLDEARGFVEQAFALPAIEVAGLYTHVPFSEPEGQAWAGRQALRFEALVRELAADGLRIPTTQAVASSGVITGLDPELGAVAVGHVLFGLSPVGPALHGAFQRFGFRPALIAIRTQFVHVGDCAGRRDLAPYLGTTVSRTGVVPVGSSQGYRSPAAGKAAAVIVRDRRVSVLRVCLASTIVDLSAVPEARVGDEVIMLGKAGGAEITLDEMCRWQAASPLTVLTGFSPQFRRRHR